MRATIPSVPLGRDAFVPGRSASGSALGERRQVGLGADEERRAGIGREPG